MLLHGRAQVLTPPCTARCPAVTLAGAHSRRASVVAASMGAVLSSSPQPSGEELWDMGIADCEAEACGLIPNGALILVPAATSAPTTREERIAELERGTQLSEGQATVVGAESAKSVNWVLDVPTISGRHARIEAVLDDAPPKWKFGFGRRQQSPVRYYITDLSSTNGTFLNRGRLRPLLPVEIKPGDVIAFGTLQSAFRVVQALSSKDFKW